MITLDIDIPEGFEATGEYRAPEVGEWYLNLPLREARQANRSDAESIILRKKVNRWRAVGDNDWYHFVGATGTIYTGWLSTDDSEARFNFGNYFRTKEQAEEASKRIHECLMSFHEELGE